MIPPKRIDIGWFDLAAAFFAGLFDKQATHAKSEVEGALFPADEGLAVLSVRSGFDLLLATLKLPPGSEVLVSALTIGDMVRIIREHDLVPVPVDVDPVTLSVSRTALESTATPRTRAVLIAHLFGSRMSMGPIAAFARDRGLLLIEDCAQAFDGRRYAGAEGADVSMFSFGPIKTRTCLGGGLLRVRRPELRRAMNQDLGGWPVQPRSEYLLRVLKYTGICLATTPLGYWVLVKAMKGGHRDRLKSMVRGFPGPEFFTLIRQRPSGALLLTMSRRIRAAAEGAIDARRTCCEDFATQLEISRPGVEAAYHTHWVFPISVAARDELIERLREEGFEATRGATSLEVVPPPPEHPDRIAPKATEMMERLVFLPVYPQVPLASRDRLLQVLRSSSVGTSPRRRSRCPGRSTKNHTNG